MNLILLILLILVFLLYSRLRRPVPHHGRRRAATVEAVVHHHRIPKPEWVRLEIIRLKALMPECGCRKVAETFNRVNVHRDMTVGKSYACSVIRKHRYEIEAQRKQVRSREHKPTLPNRVWGLDLSFIRDQAGRQHPILGIVDHGSRANLALLPLARKSAITLLPLIHAAITLHGKPKVIRTDNEGMFKSWLFRFGLWALGVRHQRTDPHCPWQNSRIERFFGTLKDRLAHWSFADQKELGTSLHLFRLWYNHVRPHQHLRGMTPAEAWAGLDIAKYPPKETLWFDAWDGLLTGYYIRR